MSDYGKVNRVCIYLPTPIHTNAQRKLVTENFINQLRLLQSKTLKYQLHSTLSYGTRPINQSTINQSTLE